MKIVWLSNAPWSATGYGNQTDTFIWRLRDSKEEDDWLRDYYDIHGCDMAEPPLRQPPHRSLHHLLVLMMRTIEQIGAGDAPSKTDLKVTKKEMTKFVGRADAARGKS